MYGSRGNIHLRGGGRGVRAGPLPFKRAPVREALADPLTGRIRGFGGRKEGGGGGQHIQVNDPEDALIISRYVSGNKIFKPLFHFSRLRTPPPPPPEFLTCLANSGRQQTQGA